MLTAEQERIFAELDALDLDDFQFVSSEEAERQIEETGHNWNIWSVVTTSSVPVVGSSGAPPCLNNGSSPCASCDCCDKLSRTK